MMRLKLLVLLCAFCSSCGFGHAFLGTFDAKEQQQNDLLALLSFPSTASQSCTPASLSFVGATAAEANAWTAVTYGNGLFVAVSRTGTNRVMTSPDGINWTARVAAEQNSWWSVTYANGLFVAVSMDGTNRS